MGATAGQVDFVDAAEWYDAPGRALAAYHRYLSQHEESHGRVRVLGELTWDGRDELETAEWIRCESVLNVTLSRLAARLVCLYGRSTLSAIVASEAMRTHPSLLADGGSRLNDRFTDPSTFRPEHRCEPAEPVNGVSMRFARDPLPVRQFVAEHARLLGLPASRLSDLMIATNEVATNAIKHGGGRGLVQLWREGDRLVCEITDPGTGDLPPDELLGIHPGQPGADHGHGLWLTRQLIDLMAVRTNQPGTSIRLYMRLTP
jgi:anti-sigma regulatory factor (Ser/Thr protein kinase)